MMMAQPVVFLTGTPVWFEAAAAALTAAGFDVRQFPYLSRSNRAAYLTTLTDHWAALVIVDGARAEWEAWVTTIKAAQETRRIPVLVVTDDETQRQRVQSVGATEMLDPAAIPAQLGARAEAIARITDPAFEGELARQSAEPLPPRGHEAVQLFNAGEYYEQHEVFEEMWMAEIGPVREMYRAVLQVGVAYYHIVRGNHRGALKMLRRSVQWFALLPDVCQEIDIRQLHADAALVRAALEAMDPADIGDFDRSLLKPVVLVAEV